MPLPRTLEGITPSGSANTQSVKTDRGYASTLDHVSARPIHTQTPPPKHDRREHLKGREIPEGPRRQQVSVARRARREVEEDDNEDSSFHSDPGTKTAARRVADSCMVSTSLPVAAQAISEQKTFSSPLAAVKTLMDAARSGDPAQLVPIIGPQAVELISSGDLGAAKQVLENFVKAYDQKHSLSSEAQGFEFLQVGRAIGHFRFRSCATAGCGISTSIAAMRKSLIAEWAETNSEPSPCARGTCRLRRITLRRDMMATPAASTLSNLTAIRISETVSTGPSPKVSPRARWAHWSRALPFRKPCSSQPETPSLITDIFTDTDRPGPGRSRRREKLYCRRQTGGRLRAGRLSCTVWFERHHDIHRQSRWCCISAGSRRADDGHRVKDYCYNPGSLWQPAQE